MHAHFVDMMTRKKHTERKREWKRMRNVEKFKIKCEKRVVSYYLCSCLFVIVDIKHVINITGFSYKIVWQFRWKIKKRSHNTMNQPHVTYGLNVPSILHANQRVYLLTIYLSEGLWRSLCIRKMTTICRSMCFWLRPFHRKITKNWERKKRFIHCIKLSMANGNNKN